ncbi:MAG: protein kinase [Acidobacteria bacterium]|nr:protein kinase [Acidobacteriota bacterium]
MIGKTLGHYQITSQIGKGGMGEVYQAKDQKLGRDVAIKVLPEEFAKDTDRVSRFQREAKLLASLNHPNIAAIYGLEEFEGTNFLVLELVEGQTLSEVITGSAGVSPASVPDILKLALQIAEALEAAHEKGIIHRDLKPSNIKVTPDGKVKVLDFGLAKAYAGDQEVNLSNSPTLSNVATRQGVILGTAAYMSPEQARGKSVDKKADIWAFGCVLFEMLTGRAAFSGKDVTDILAAVIRAEPEWTSLPANLHWRLQEVLNRCLKKDAGDRYHDISDVKADIQRVLADPSGVLVQPGMAIKPRKKMQLGPAWVATAVILTAIIAGVAVWKLKPMAPPQVTRFSYELPKDQQFGALDERALAVSPDGRQLVYGTTEGLYLLAMNELDAKPIPGAGANPQKSFFSPDGKWIGFWSTTDNQLKKIAVSGGASVTLTNVASLGSFSWREDDTIVYGNLRVSANGGTPETLIKAQGIGNLLHTQILPDGQSVLFTNILTQPYRTMVYSFKSGKSKELFVGDTAQYLPTGHIVYGLGNDLVAVPFDLDKLDLAGGSVPLVEGVFRAGGAPQYAVSDSGTLVYIPGASAGLTPGQRNLVWVDQKGKEEPLAAAPNDYRAPRISPDGTKIAVSVYSGNKSDIWIWDIARESITRLTFGEASMTPLWSLDGKRVAFASGAWSNAAIYWKAADGTGEDEKLGDSQDRSILPWAWSKDAKTLITIDYTSGGFDIGSLPMEGDHKWSPLLRGKYIELQPKFSPDGRWMAYMSAESGNNEIYVRPFPEISKGRWQVSTNRGTCPLWAPDGRKIYYRQGSAVMAVPVEITPTFNPGKPEILFQGSYVGLSLNDAHTWDISPDGKRFLMMKGPETPVSTADGPRKINVVLNWFEELKQRVPVK